MTIFRLYSYTHDCRLPSRMHEPVSPDTAPYLRLASLPSRPSRQRRAHQGQLMRRGEVAMPAPFRAVSRFPVLSIAVDVAMSWA